MNRKTFFLIMVLILNTSYSYAFTSTYEVYTGYDAIAGAFGKIALIYNAVLYKGLFIGIVGIAATVALIGGAITGIRTGRHAITTNAVMLLLGFVVFASLIMPKGDLIITQESLGLSTVASLPVGLVAIAGTVNNIERALVKVIEETSTIALSGTVFMGEPNMQNLYYSRMPGGFGLALLELATRNSPMPIETSFIKSVAQYTTDCVFVVGLIPNAPFNNNVLSKAVDFQPIFELAADPSLPTVIYDDMNCSMGGCPTTCQDAWFVAGTWGSASGINSKLTELKNAGPDINNKALKYICGAAGFVIDPNNNARTDLSLIKCSEILTAMYNATAVGEGSGNFATSGSSSGIYWQSKIANILNSTVSGQGTNGFAVPAGTVGAMAQNNNMMLGGFGAMANEWLPIGKAVVVAVTVALTPLISLLILTPAWGAALGTIMGLFVWIMCWGVADALTHTIALDYSINYIRSNMIHGGVGMSDILTLPTASAKAMALFGMVRGSGVALATMMAGLITKYGSYAMGGVAGGVTSQTQASATSGIMGSASYGGQASSQAQAMAAQNTMAAGWDSRGRAAMASDMNNIGRNNAVMNTMLMAGGGDFVAGAMTMGLFAQSQEKSKIMAAGGDAGRQNTVDYQQASKVLQVGESVAARHGGNLDGAGAVAAAHAAFKEGQDIGSAGMANALQGSVAETTGQQNFGKNVGTSLGAARVLAESGLTASEAGNIEGGRKQAKGIAEVLNQDAALKATEHEKETEIDKALRLTGNVSVTDGKGEQHLAMNKDKVVYKTAKTGSAKTHEDRVESVKTRTSNTKVGTTYEGAFVDAVTGEAVWGKIETGSARGKTVTKVVGTNVGTMQTEKVTPVFDKEGKLIGTTKAVENITGKAYRKKDGSMGVNATTGTQSNVVNQNLGIQAGVGWTQMQAGTTNGITLNQNFNSLSSFVEGQQRIDYMSYETKYNIAGGAMKSVTDPGAIAKTAAGVGGVLSNGGDIARTTFSLGKSVSALEAPVKSAIKTIGQSNVLKRIALMITPKIPDFPGSAMNILLQGAKKRP